MKFDIRITDKIATAISPPEIICGNADYVINFIFDTEWEEYEIKTAVFTYKRKGQTKYKEVVFTGTECNIPVLSGISEVSVGVYAGNLHTTTPAILQCKKSALCDIAKIDDTPTSVYNQLLEILKDNYPVEAGVRANEAAQATEEYLQTAKADMQEFENEIELQIANILNFAPQTLDTLAEIAEALGNDPNFATTITNLIANTKNELNDSIAKKVDKENGKGLSENDFTTDEKNKLAGLLTQEQIADFISPVVLWTNTEWENSSGVYEYESGSNIILPLDRYKRITIIAIQRGYSSASISLYATPCYQTTIDIFKKGDTKAVLEATEIGTDGIYSYSRPVEIYISETSSSMKYVTFGDAQTSTIWYKDGEGTPTLNIESRTNGFMIPIKIIGHKF